MHRGVPGAGGHDPREETLGHGLGRWGQLSRFLLGATVRAGQHRDNQRTRLHDPQAPSWDGSLFSHPRRGPACLLPWAGGKGETTGFPLSPQLQKGNPTPQPPLTQALRPGSPLRSIASLTTVRMSALLTNVP